jgi:hypothetical protein
MVREQKKLSVSIQKFTSGRILFKDLQDAHLCSLFPYFRKQFSTKVGNENNNSNFEEFLLVESDKINRLE